MVPGRQIEYNLPCIHLQLLMHCVSFWSISACVIFFLIFVFESLNFTLFTRSLERVQICKRCWKTERFAGPDGFF